MKNIRKRGLQLIVALYTSFLYDQIGINTPAPSAGLDIVSKGNTSATKALEINNSSGTELVTVLDDGKLGIGASAPAYNLEAKGTVAFPDVAYNNVVGPFNALGINNSTGAIGTFSSSAQPIFVMATAGTSNPISSGHTGSYNMNFGVTPIINTAGIVTGQNTGLTLSDGSSPATVNYYQASQAGMYKIEVTGTFKCNSGGSGYIPVNINLWKAPNNTSYVIQDDYRIVVIDNSIGTSAAPFSQSFIMNLAANDRIALRYYQDGSLGSWADCAMRLPTSGDQKYSMRLTITKL